MCILRSRITLKVHIDSTADNGGHMRFILVLNWKCRFREALKSVWKESKHSLYHAVEWQMLVAKEFKRTHGQHILEPQVEEFSNFRSALLDSMFFVGWAWDDFGFRLEIRFWELDHGFCKINRGLPCVCIGITCP